MSVLLHAVQDWTGGGAIALSVLRAVTSIIEHGEVNQINKSEDTFLDIYFPVNKFSQIATVF